MFVPLPLFSAVGDMPLYWGGLEGSTEARGDGEIRELFLLLANCIFHGLEPTFFTYRLNNIQH
jgi:hypothetical protein